MNNSAKSNDTQPPAAIILAAGKGERMNSDLPKVAHVIAGKPIVRWVVESVREAGGNRIVLVVGYGAQTIRDIFADDDHDLEFVTQEEQLGTGHATRCAEDCLQDFSGEVLVLAGDGPLIRADTIRTMLATHRNTGAAATLATSVIDDPTGYGRIIRDNDGRFQVIVEHKNATDAQKQIHEVYPSYACFDARELFTQLANLKPNALTGEYYLTEVPEMLAISGKRVEVVDAVPPEDVLSINTPAQLREVEMILLARDDAKPQAAGVGEREQQK